MPVGRVVYTQMLNRHGGIECDLTVTRLADDAYLVVTAAAAATHDAAWIRQQPRRRARRAHRRDRRHRRARRDGPALARAALAAHRGRSVERGVPVPRLARDLARVGPRARVAGHVRRRARLGALRAGGVRRRRLRRAGGRRRGSRAPPRGLSRDGLAAHREGVPLVGPRPRQRGHAAPGRARLRRAPRQARALHRPRRAPGAARAAARHAGWWCSCSTIRSRCSITTSRSGGTARSSAASRRAPTATRSGAPIGLGYVEHADGVTDAFVAGGRWEIEIACERVHRPGTARAALRSEVAPRARREAGAAHAEERRARAPAQSVGA